MELDEIYEKAVSIVGEGDFDEFKRLLEGLKSVLEFEHGLRSKRSVLMKRIDRAVFFGDIHGDLDTLYILCKKIDMVGLLKEDWHVVFLGDYIDRGHRQLETLVFISMLKTSYRGNVVTLRGNHEPYKHLIPYPHDYPEKLALTFGRTGGLELYDLSRSLFDLMPIALLIPGKLLAVHGGPPVLRVINYDNASDILDVDNDDEAIEDMLWSDPIEDEDADYMLSYRGAGKLWGPPITIKTLNKLGIKIIVRGHEPVDGYRLSHGGRVLTLFSMKGYYGNTLASCLVVDLDTLEDPRFIEKSIISV